MAEKKAKKSSRNKEPKQAVGDVERRDVERRSVVDRRLGLSLDRRRGPGRRRTDERKAAEEGQMTDEQFAFLIAINDYKKQNQRPFPTWTEVLEVIKAMGYRKVADPESLASFKKEEPI